MAELQGSLPHGWDCLYDKKSGKPYYINHITKTTTWEDPRLVTKQRFQPPMAHPVEHVLQDLPNLGKNSPRTSRMQETSFSSTVVNTEEAVTKISTMFPTVSDTHIRLLLKKYMKFIFPKAEETMILDILSCNDNNIQKASDILKEMGYVKRENGKPVRTIIKPEPPKIEEPQPIVLPKMKTVADKKIIQSKIEAKYKDIPGQVITIALDSVDFDEQRAEQILDIMVQEENDKTDSANDAQVQSNEEVVSDTITDTLPISHSRQSLKSLLKTDKSDYSMKESPSFSRVIEESSDDMGGDFKSPNITDTNGANRNLVKGANHDLLLEDYIKWQGPQPRLHQGPMKSLAKGPNPSLRKTRNYQVCGPNAELRKGPKIGLAKGSIFSQFKGVVIGESRGK
ncbi:hypothetical protein FQR65_LT00840 [Abscondita terminalis]|nr:hypothetical protein FQR65_LT00840 [Abscondita terminalis]